ncbi:MAG: phytanoyl-CoA dioxygenase family protein [Calditrichota bacterium]
MSNFTQELNQPYVLSESNIQQFQKEGYVKLKDVFSVELLEYYGREITEKVIELNTMHLPMEERSTYQKAFLQIMNLWRDSEVVKEFVFGNRLAKIAADLLEVRGVRLYHDQALYKEPSGGITPWHADQYYWPLESEKTVTAWIPLQETPLEMGPLAFAAQSQQFSYGRELPISDESEAALQKALAEANYQHVIEPFDLGEVSFHYGWTFHNAGPNHTTNPRRVMTVIYMEEDMRLKAPSNDSQKADWEMWCPGAKVGEIITTELNPVIYSSRGEN